MKMSVLNSLSFLLCTLWIFAVSSQTVKNYETVTIEECVPGKYFWRESHPQEFYACLTLSKKAVKMRCLAGKYMCNSGPKVFQPCMCKENPGQTQNTAANSLPLNENALKADGGLSEMKDGRFSQFAKMAPGDTEDAVLARMRQEVDAAIMSTPAPRSQSDPGQVVQNSVPASGCPDAYKVHTDTHMLGGTVQSTITELEQCQISCLESSECIGVDWNKEGDRSDNERCYFITPETAAGYRSKMKNTCCDHYRRTLCNGNNTYNYGDTDDSYYNNAYVRVGSGGRANGVMERTQPTEARVITTTTTSSPMTQPPMDATTTIPDSGCPYTYEEFPGVSHPFGQNVTDGPGVDEVEECKYWCLVRAYCHGVDYDANTRTCYYLAQVEPQLATQGVSGVTHYRKVDCTRPLRCFVDSSEVEDPSDLSITDPNTPQTRCNGVCYTRETISRTTNSIDRGCMASSVPVALGCQLSEDYYTITCFCDTMRCNALSVVAMATQLLHMPLDDDLSDHSGTSNSATVPDQYTPPDFQCLDKAINCSALFTGNQCIKVPSLTNTDLGVIGQDFRFSPEATFAVHFKRISVAGRDVGGGIFGNSDNANVQPTWQMTSRNYDNYTSAGLISEETRLKSLMDYDFVRADNDQWHLMIMTYEGLFDYDQRLFPKLSLYLDGEAIDGNSMLEQGKIGIGSSPVTIGCVAGEHFFGYIDDARIFVTSLSQQDITALSVMRDENYWY